MMLNFTSLKIFFRNIRKQKVVTLMNVLGLSLGMAVALLIWPWAFQEFSYDKFHQNEDRIYRTLMYAVFNDNAFYMGKTSRPLGSTAQEKIPEIEKMCRVVSLRDTKIEVNHQVYERNQVIMTDENFFDFFTFSLKSGDKMKVLNTPDGMVIDESTAALLFPGENAIGKIITFDGQDWQVTGIMSDLPVNTHIEANIVIPSYGEYKKHHWNGYFYYGTYFQLQQGTNLEQLTEQLNRMGMENMPTFKQWKSHFTLEPLRDIHFGAEVNGRTNSKPLAITLILAALIILLISCINFTSLFISVSFLRACSVGIRQTHGADRKSLIWSFYKETFFYVLLSAGLAVGIAIILRPVYNQLLNTNFQFNFGHVQFYVFWLLVCVFTAIMAGTFPAFYMTRFNIVQTLSGRFKGNKLSFLQKGLLVIQFTVALACLLTAFFVHKQVDTMITLNLGANKENILYVYLQDKLMPASIFFREELKKNPSVVDVTVKDCLPYNQKQAMKIKKKDAQEPVEYYTEICQVRGNYFDFMNMKLLAGENPFTSDGSVKNYCVVNETAVHKLNLQEPLGTYLEVESGKEYIVAGVVKDTYTKMLNQSVDPQVYLAFDHSYYSSGYILVKVNGNPQSTIRDMQKIWKERIPEGVFEYDFLDKAYKVLYEKEIGLSELFSWFMLFTLLISLSGLFNMSYYAVGRRVKEIGLRKINGATQLDLLVLLNRDFVIWILTAFLIACPVAWLFITYWQQTFVVKTSLSWWVFALTAVLTILLVLLTVSYQTIRTSRVNPVDVLKSE